MKPDGDPTPGMQFDFFCILSFSLKGLNLHFRQAILLQFFPPSIDKLLS